MNEKKIKLKTGEIWQERLVAGNGHSGVICSCDPYEEVLTYQNIELLMPTEEPRMTPPEVGSELQEARQAVLHMDATWNVHGRKRTYLYAYHPGMQLRITTPQQELEAYSRRMVGETGEVIMDYRDKTGDFSRHTFVSREDCVVTQYLAGGKKTLPELILSIDPLETLPKFGVKKWGTGPEVNMKYELVYDEAGTYLGQAAHYPVFVESELQDKGYVTMVRILHTGGSRNVEQTEGSKKIHIRGAQAVWILAKTAAQVEMGEMEDFPGVKAQETIDAVLADLKSAVAKYRTKEGSWDYERALALQKEQQRETYGTVSFHLGEQTADSGEEGVEKETNTELLQRQKNTPQMLQKLMEQIYQTGRYVQAACAGYSAPRLCGLWTGEWNVYLK